MVKSEHSLNISSHTKFVYKEIIIVPLICDVVNFFVINKWTFVMKHDSLYLFESQQCGFIVIYVNSWLSMWELFGTFSCFEGDALKCCTNET